MDFPRSTWKQKQQSFFCTHRDNNHLLLCFRKRTNYIIIIKQNKNIIVFPYSYLPRIIYDSSVNMYSVNEKMKTIHRLEYINQLYIRIIYRTMYDNENIFFIEVCKTK